MLTSFENFNAKVRITRPVESRDTRGSIVRAYRTVAQDVPALVIPNTAFESRQYGGERSGKTGTARFPFCNDVRPQDRLVWGTRILEVVGVMPQHYAGDGAVSSVLVNWSEIDESPVASSEASNPAGPV